MPSAFAASDPRVAGIAPSPAPLLREGGWRRMPCNEVRELLDSLDGCYPAAPLPNGLMMRAKIGCSGRGAGNAMPAPIWLACSDGVKALL